MRKTLTLPYNKVRVVTLIVPSSNDTAGQIGKCMEAEGKRINDDQSTCHDPDQSDSSGRSGSKGMVGNVKGDALAGGDSNPRRKSHDEKNSGGYHYR